MLYTEVRDLDRLDRSDWRSPRRPCGFVMRLTCLRFRWSLFRGVLAALAVGWVLCAWRAPAVAAGPLGAARSPGGLVAVGAPGSAGEVARPDPRANQEETDWQRQINRVERRRLITIMAFLGVVFVALVFWWSWGKLHHRAHKL
jgi:hypothetical protein